MADGSNNGAEERRATSARAARSTGGVDCDRARVVGSRSAPLPFAVGPFALVCDAVASSVVGAASAVAAFADVPTAAAALLSPPNRTIQITAATLITHRPTAAGTSHSGAERRTIGLSSSRLSGSGGGVAGRPGAAGVAAGAVLR